MRLLTALRHPNLVTLLGGAIGPNGQRCLVYELMKGGSADDYLSVTRRSSNGGGSGFEGLGRKGRLGWRERVKILAGAARGLQFLHEAKPPVVHLDFKVHFFSFFFFQGLRVCAIVLLSNMNGGRVRYVGLGLEH